jgi:cytochrome c-type biogenesis protein CcmH/NrfG
VNRNTIYALLAGLLIGGVVGYVGGSLNAPAGPVVAAPTAPPAGAPPGGFAPPADPNAMNLVGRIQAMQQLVAKDPKNVQAWIQLGNDYFDTKQPHKSIEAYGKALELQPDNPDVLTDQGVMYRDVGQFQQALANFQKANAIDPKHVQSLFNVGVVYENDLKDSARAKAAWQKVIEVAPQSPQAQAARQALAGP